MSFWHLSGLSATDNELRKNGEYPTISGGLGIDIGKNIKSYSIRIGTQYLQTRQKIMFDQYLFNETNDTVFLVSTNYLNQLNYLQFPVSFGKFFEFNSNKIWIELSVAYTLTQGAYVRYFSPSASNLRDVSPFIRTSTWMGGVNAGYSRKISNVLRYFVSLNYQVGLQSIYTTGFDYKQYPILIGINFGIKINQ